MLPMKVHHVKLHFFHSALDLSNETMAAEEVIGKYGRVIHDMNNVEIPVKFHKYSRSIIP